MMIMKCLATLAFTALAFPAMAETPAGLFRHCTTPIAAKGMGAVCTNLAKLHQEQMAACLAAKMIDAPNDPNTGSHHVYKTRYMMCQREVAEMNGPFGH
jgi:hypothetical protein